MFKSCHHNKSILINTFCLFLQVCFVGLVRLHGNGSGLFHSILAFTNNDKHECDHGKNIVVLEK